MQGELCPQSLCRISSPINTHPSIARYRSINTICLVMEKVHGSNLRHAKFGGEAIQQPSTPRLILFNSQLDLGLFFSTIIISSNFTADQASPIYFRSVRPGTSGKGYPPARVRTSPFPLTPLEVLSSPSRALAPHGCCPFSLPRLLSHHGDRREAAAGPDCHCWHVLPAFGECFDARRLLDVDLAFTRWMVSQS